MHCLLFFVLFFFLNLLLPVIYCEKGEILPFGEILSGVADIANVITAKKENASVDPVAASASRINLKIVPSKKLSITKNDLMFLMSEIRQEIRRQMSILEDELEEKERMRKRSSSLWTTSHSAVYAPEESVDNTQEMGSLEEEEREEIENLLDSLNTLDKEDQTTAQPSTSYNVQIGGEEDEQDAQNGTAKGTRFTQKALRNGTTVWRRFCRADLRASARCIGCLSPLLYGHPRTFSFFPFNLPPLETTRPLNKTMSEQLVCIQNGYP
ncbi:hypothetical protein PVMG_01218 [Plasmodium vivax Mauritania I]|uniref:Secreted ookinete protein n=1 Tax=Plasmodium vivax Mauritania I TaxID=1035515 RepID=A0A0J9TAW0_PLAVI|nr:hypothetical protein PVMG_01218 [Plasmodium vivax Mauritania I]